MTITPVTPPASLTQRKASLRTETRSRLSELTASLCEAESNEVCGLVRSLPSWQRAERVLLYAPIMGEHGAKALFPELDVRPLLKAAWANGRVVCLPGIDWDRGEMHAVTVNGPDPTLEIRRHGVPEPVGGERIEPRTLDAIIVPGLAFDDDGGRLGRGGGFYDRFLGEILRAPSLTKPMLIGVGFSVQRVSWVPREPHDIVLDAAVIGGTGVIRSCEIAATEGHRPGAYVPRPFLG
ncbi:MAG: 5-formyltetrahydrofolate cyclo-ligase [Planctomycetota bacterium]